MQKNNLFCKKIDKNACDINDFLQKNKKWPIIFKGIDESFFAGATTLDARTACICITPTINGYNFPQWFLQLEKNLIPLLVIKNLDKVDIDRQLQFVELLKHKSISSVKLPQDCQIIILGNFKKIHPNIKSLCLLKEF